MKRLSVKSKFVRWLLKGVPLEQLKIGEHSVVLDADKITYGDGSVYPPASSAQGDLLVRGALVWDRLAKIATGKYLKATATTYEGADIAEADIPAHMAKSKLAWTADKLLKGAGVGADPTEIALGLVDTGATVPTSPVTGQLFLHTPTGRKVLLQYDGSAWQPIQSYGTMTVYVDKTDGTDDLEHGTGVDANAFKTIQYALNLIKPIASLGGLVTINVNGENYGEDLYFRGVSPGRVEVNGTPYVNVSGGVATGGLKGSGSTAAKVTGTFTANEHNNRLIKFTSGSNNGIIVPIGLTNTDALYLVCQGLNAAPANGDTYDILTWSTKTSSFHGEGSATDIAFYHFEFDGSGTPYGNTIFYLFETRAELGRSHIITGSYDMFKPDRSFSRCDDSILQFTANTYHWAIVAGAANPDIFNTRIVGVGHTNYGVQVTYDGYVALRGCELAGLGNGLQGNLGGKADFYTIDVTSFIHGCNYGLYLYQHSQAVRTSATYIKYGVKLDGTADANVSANTSVDTASGSWNEG